MTRERLPNRRAALTYTIPGPDPSMAFEYDVSVGFQGEAVREVFVSCHKTTTAMDIAGRDIGTLISIALQYGAEVKELASAMCRDEGGAPQGIAGAVLDSMEQVPCDT
jgi:hypothetical protein